MSTRSLSTDEASTFANKLKDLDTQRLIQSGYPDVQPIPLRIAYRLGNDRPVPERSRSTEEPIAPGIVLGGLSGMIFGSYLEVKLLWVAEELRGKGVGAALLKRAEDEARARGCLHAIVDTFDFQAEGFYLKNQYIPYARLPGAMAIRIYFSKSLEPLSGYVWMLRDRDFLLYFSEPKGLGPRIRHNRHSRRPIYISLYTSQKP